MKTRDLLKTPLIHEDVDYVPKHMKKEEFLLSEYARNLLNDLRTCDPWAAEGINRSIERYQEVTSEIGHGPFDRQPEDAVNMLAAECLALLICTADMTGPIDSLLETIELQLETLEGK